MVLRSLPYQGIARRALNSPTPYFDIELHAKSLVKFDHDEVVINSFGETLDRGDSSAHTKRRLRVIDHLKQRIMQAEDEEIFKVLDTIAKSGNNDI